MGHTKGAGLMTPESPQTSAYTDSVRAERDDYAIVLCVELCRAAFSRAIVERWTMDWILPCLHGFLRVHSKTMRTP